MHWVCWPPPPFFLRLISTISMLCFVVTNLTVRLSHHANTRTFPLYLPMMSLLLSLCCLSPVVLTILGSPRFFLSVPKIKFIYFYVEFDWKLHFNFTRIKLLYSITKEKWLFSISKENIKFLPGILRHILLYCLLHILLHRLLQLLLFFIILIVKVTWIFTGKLVAFIITIFFQTFSFIF